MIIYSVKDVRNGSRSARIRTLAITSSKVAAAKRKRERRQNKSVAKTKDI